MKFGKLRDFSGVDFTLPPDPAQQAAILPSTVHLSTDLSFFTGATGWSMKEWVGTVYPEGTKTRDYLRYYTRQFNTIELNTTHYRIPDLDTIRRWREESTPDFRFCPKAPQTISHSNDLGLGGEQINLFCRAVAALKEKIGCCFIQLPPYFDAGRLRLLERFLEYWPREIPLAAEVRHPSWFTSAEATENWLRTLTKYQVAAVITDVAGRRDVLHMGRTAPRTLIRFVGNGLHPTDHQRIDEWVNRLRLWAGQGLQEVFFFTHEPDNILAPQLAAYLTEQLQPFPEIHTRGPQIPYPFTEPGTQMNLF